MNRLVALDTETTGLNPKLEDVWEVAMVDLGTGEEAVWRLAPSVGAVERMHPRAAQVNRYHERTAAAGWRWDDPVRALDDMDEWLDGAHIVGAVPDFDARFLAALYERCGRPRPAWNHHLVCIQAQARGWLRGIERESPGSVPAHVFDIPWRSDDLSRACGVQPPGQDARHTALADARWVAEWWHVIEAPRHRSVPGIEWPAPNPKIGVEWTGGSR